MLVGLVLRSLRGWLQDYVGVDLENSDYQVEQLSHNHLRFELKDVTLTTAVWRFLVGPILPLTVESGRVDQVRVEVNSETLSVDITGVSVQIRKCQPEEWCNEAEAYKARLLKEKRNWARGALAQTELRKWIKAKIRVTVSNAQAVLQESEFMEAKVAGYCDYVHVADPDHETWASVESASSRCLAPWDQRARDAQLQMAKDVLIRGARAFFLADGAAKKLKAASFGREDLPEAAALCPEILASAAYRAWDYGALHDEVLSHTAQTSARRVLAIHAAAVGAGGSSSSSSPPPLTVRVNTASYSFLTGFLANMDSLYFMWSAALAEFYKPAGRKPTSQEAERYLELWKQSAAGAGFGSSYELSRLEDQFLWGFAQRLRRRAEEELFREGVKSTGTGWCSEQASSTGEGRRLFCPGTGDPVGAKDGRSMHPDCSLTELLEESNLSRAPHFEEQLHRNPIQQKMSPKIPEALVSQCLAGDMGGPSPRSGDAEQAEALEEPMMAVESREFALDSVYRVVLPRLEVKLDLNYFPGEVLQTLDIALPDLAVCYSSHLDCRYLSVHSSSVSASEHSGEARGHTAELLSWDGLRVVSRNFGDMGREVCISGEPSPQLRRLWPYLRNFPGLRSFEPYPEAIQAWFPQATLPEELAKALAQPSGGRQTTWVLNCPTVRVPLSTEIAGASPTPPALNIVAVNFQLSYSSLHGVHSLRLPKAEVLCPGAAPAASKPLLEISGLVVDRLGDFDHNWAKVDVEKIDVNISPYLLLVFRSHIRAYDPNVRFSSSSSAQPASGKQERRPLPKLALTLKSSSLRLWQHGADGLEKDQGPKLRLYLNMLELTTVKSMVVGVGSEEAEGIVRVKLMGLLGDSRARAGGCSVFACSALEGCNVFQHPPVLELKYAWMPGRTQVTLATASLQMSPTQGLLDCLYLLLPILKSSAAAAAPVPEQGLATSETIPPEYMEGEERPSTRSQSEGGATSSKLCIVIHDVDLGLHLGSTEHGAALARTEGFEEACAASAAAARRVSARFTAADVEAHFFEGCPDWRPAELRAKRLCLAVGQVAAETESTERHSGGLLVTWLAVLSQIQAAAVLKSPSFRGEEGSSSSSRCRAASAKLGSLALWTTGIRDKRLEDQADPRTKSELLRLCPPRPAEEDEPDLVRLVKMPGSGSSPWLSFSLQGVWLDGSFRNLEPSLQDGCVALRVEGDEILCSRFGQRWQRAGGDAWTEKGRFHDAPVRLNMDPQVVSVEAAPTQLMLRRMDLLPLCRLLSNIKELIALLPSTSSPQEDAPNLTGSHAQTQAPPKLAVRRQLFLRADIEVRLAELPGCPSLALRCVPAPELVRGHSQLSVRLKEFALELLEASSEGHGAYSKATARLALAGLQLTLQSTAAGTEVSVAVDNINATHGVEHQMWLRMMATSMHHLDFKYCARSQLVFSMEPTALRVHSAWMKPVASLLFGFGWWRNASRLGDPDASWNGLGLTASVPKTDRAGGLADAVRPLLTGEDLSLKQWMGTVWQLQGEPGVDPEVPPPTRVILQVQPDGSLWVRRDSASLWVPLLSRSFAASNFRHFETTMFPYGICCTNAEFSSHSRCAVAFDAAEERDAVVRIFTALHVQRMRNSQPPMPTVSTVSRHPQQWDRPSLVSATDMLRNGSTRIFQRSRSVGTTLARLGASARSPASSAARSVGRTLASSPFSKRSPQTPGQASAAAPSDEGDEVAAAAAAASTAAAPAQGMAVQIELKGLEFWLPSELEVLPTADACFAWTACQFDNRELGFLVVASAEGETGKMVQVSVSHLAAVQAPLNRCWWPDSASTEEEPSPEPQVADDAKPWPQLRREVLEDLDATTARVGSKDRILMSSFGALEHWMHSADSPSPPNFSPKGEPMPSPYDLDSSRHSEVTLLQPGPAMPRLISPAEEAAATPLRRLSRGEACDGQLVDTRGLTMLLLWNPERIVGVRLESFIVDVPLELMRWWAGFKEHTTSFMEFSTNSSDLLQAPPENEMSLWATSMKLPPSTGPLRQQMEQEDSQVRKWPSLFSGRSLRSSNSTLASESSAALAKTDSQKSINSNQGQEKKTCGWRLQFDALGFLDLRLSGGILAPQHWLALRVAELHARGALMPQEGEPLSFMLLCDVVCHNAPAAQLEPVVEQFELTVDVERRHKEISCCATTARINVNIDTVLVNFFRTVRRGLEEVREGPLQPARRFEFRNGTGVKITVKWRQLRTRTSVDLDPGQCSDRFELRQAEKFADVRFWLQDIDAEEYVTIDLDHVIGRAYQMREGCPIFVEPDHDLKEGTCTLNIKSALTIYNDTAMPLRIMLGPPAFQRWRHQVGDLLRSGTRGLVSFSQTAAPPVDEKDADDSFLSAEFGMGVTRTKGEVRVSSIELPAYSAAEVPVSWFLFARGLKPMVRLQPIGTGFTEGRAFPQLSSLLEEVAVAEEEDYDEEDLAATGAANLGRRRTPEEKKMGDRTKFSLFLRTYMKLAGYIDAEDMPLALDDEDVQQVQRFKMHLGNMLAIRNMLPFPVVLQLAAPEGGLNETPAPNARSLHDVLRSSSSKRGASSLLLGESKEDPSAACFAQAEDGSLVQHSQLEGISQLTTSTPDQTHSYGVATYALDVDQEVALPFAKRLLRLRCFSLCEELLSTEGGETSEDDEDFRQSFKTESTIGDEELASTLASASCLLKLPAISANRPHHQYLNLETPSGQLMQVTLELTRDSCVLFVPYIFENLTPLNLQLQRDASSSVAPGCRRVLPVDPLHPDSAFFSLATKAEERPAQSPTRISFRKQSSSGLSPSANSRTSSQSLCFEIPGLGDVGREHRYYAVDRRQQTRRDYHQEATPSHRRNVAEGNPAIALDMLMQDSASEGSPTFVRTRHRIPVLRGLVVDSLSFGTCVRTAAAPLRRTKVLCLFPRYFVKSELEHAIDLGFEGSPSEVEIHLQPGECVPVHPPQSLDRSDRLYFRHEGLSSEPFSFQGLDGVEHCRTFHVYRDRSGDSGQGRFEPAFVQVDIQKTTFPAKNHVPMAEGYFLVLRPRDFRCAEDLLFHFDNQTPYSYFATISGSSTERSAKLLILEGGSHLWQHLFGFQDADECLKVQVKLIRDNAALREQRPRLSRGLVSLSLGDALTSRSSTKPFALEASLRLTAAYLERAPSTAEEPADLVVAETLAGSSYCMARWHRRLRVQGEFVINCWRTQAFVPHKARVELIFEDLNRQKKAQDPEVFVAAIQLVEACEGEEDAEKGRERVMLALRDKWQVCFVSGERLRSGMLQGSPAWRQQLLEAAARQEVVELQTHLELRFSTTSGGAHNFTIKPAPGWSGPAVRDEIEGGKEKSSWNLSINVPVLSVSWIHRHEEVLAVRVKGIRLEVGQHTTDRSFDVGMQHLQVDHFIDGGELPVVLNRRFLHINSRWLREKAVQLSAKWISGSHIIKKLSVSLVPYWLNLELGVLIRLLDLAESSLGVNEASPDEGVRVPLAPPHQPSSLADAKHMEVWRLETLVVQPLRLTIMVRSPDTAAARDHTMARRIRFLPVDMPNMDLKVDQTVLTNQFGSIQQLLGTLGNQYKRKARNSALLSVTLSYMAAILKGSMNALWWLARGPYDAVDAALPLAEEKRPWLYWVEPLVQGMAEGTYRAFAELVGNSLFGIVLVLNSIRQLILGVPRPRAQSFLDGILQGFAGLMIDTFLTPTRQLILQTQVAYHDWGILRASLVFILCLLRISLGPALGVLHLAASSIEGLANLLLHEEAQFAPFETRRSVEPISLPRRVRPQGAPQASVPPVGSQASPHERDRTRTREATLPSTAFRSSTTAAHGGLSFQTATASKSMGTGSLRLGPGEAQQSWWKRKYGSLKQMLTDDDAVMDRVQLPVQYALNP